MASENKPLSLRELILSDLKRYSIRHTGGLWPLYYMIAIPGFSTAFIHRLSHAFYGKGFLGRHIGHFFWHLNYFLHSCDISYRAQIGEGLFIPHPIGVVFGAGRIGKDATLYQNSTVGLRSLTKGEVCRDLFPVLGDNVTLSAGAAVLGSIKVGNNVAVGANAVVLTDVPDNSTAIGIPARIVLKNA